VGRVERAVAGSSKQSSEREGERGGVQGWVARVYKNKKAEGGCGGTGGEEKASVSG